MTQIAQEQPHAVSRAEWLAARKVLLAREKELIHARDALSAERRALPMVRIEKPYRFAASDGQASLPDLFEGRRQLIVYHFMFDPEWDEGCPSCSHCADNFAGAIVHLAARDISFVAISRAPLAKIEAFKRRMGWSFRWVSSFGSDFNYDFHVTLDEDAGSVEYNYASAAALHAGGKLWYTRGELPGLSVFLREGDEIYHSYSTYARGLDPLLTTYTLLDMTPLGRRDEAGGNPQAWIRYHDRYAPSAAADVANCCHDHAQ